MKLRTAPTSFSHKNKTPLPAKTTPIVTRPTATIAAIAKSKSRRSRGERTTAENPAARLTMVSVMSNRLSENRGGGASVVRIMIAVSLLKLLQQLRVEKVCVSDRREHVGNQVVEANDGGTLTVPLENETVPPILIKWNAAD